MQNYDRGDRFFYQYFILIKDSSGTEGGARWLSVRTSDARALGPGFEPHNRHVVSLSKTI